MSEIEKPEDVLKVKFPINCCIDNEYLGDKSNIPPDIMLIGLWTYGPNAKLIGEAYICKKHWLLSPFANLKQFRIF